MSFGKVADVDKLILQNLDDKDLFNICLVDKYFRDICKDNFFWYNRFIKNFGQHAAKYKPEKRKWRDHYIKVIRDINYLNNGDIPEISLKPMSAYNWWFFKLVNWHLDDNIIHIHDFDYEGYYKAVTDFQKHDYLKPYQKKIFDIGLKLGFTEKITLEEKLEIFKKYKYELSRDIENAGEIAQNIYWLSYLAKDKVKIIFERDGTVEYTLDYFKGKDNGMWDYPNYFTPAKIVKILKDCLNEVLTESDIIKHNINNPNIIPEESTLRDYYLSVSHNFKFNYFYADNYYNYEYEYEIYSDFLVIRVAFTRE